ncbi:MAG: hypothetical protein WD097_00550 [Balneolales bacterium]
MKSWTKRIVPQNKSSFSRLLTSIMPGIAILSALAWVGHELGPEERIILFRYLAMVFAGCMAFITPHMLFPDNNKLLVIQLNLSPLHLFLKHLRTMRLWWLFAVSALIVIAYADTNQPTAFLEEKSRLLFTGIIGLTGIMMYALYRFSTIGAQSQHWHEGKTGFKMFDSMKNIGMSSPVGAGMYPTFISTILVTLIGMMTVVVSAALPNILAGVIPFVLLVLWSGYRLASEIPKYDRLYYQSDAFYDELFTNPATGNKESREPAGYDAIYWVPHRWRPAVWSQIIQMDRKRPMGRIIALLSFTYWLLIYMGVPESWFSGWLIFLILVKNLLAWPVSDIKLSPPVFQWWMMPPGDWVIVRFFLLLRWTLTVFLTVGVAALFSASVGWNDVWFWSFTDLFVSAITAWMFTRNNEYDYKKKYI